MLRFLKFTPALILASLMLPNLKAQNLILQPDYSTIIEICGNGTSCSQVLRANGYMFTDYNPWFYNISGGAATKAQFVIQVSDLNAHPSSVCGGSNDIGIAFTWNNDTGGGGGYCLTTDDLVNNNVTAGAPAIITIPWNHNIVYHDAFYFDLQSDGTPPTWYFYGKYDPSSNVCSNGANFAACLSSPYGTRPHLIGALAIFNDAAGGGIPPSAISLAFPVDSDPACGGTCTPTNAPIFAAFDHQMLNAYEQICPGGSTPANWGTIVDFRGEIANQNRHPPKGTGYGICETLYGYESSNTSAQFLVDVAYRGNNVNILDNNVLWYDSHPGYDYGFGYGTKVSASVSGCVSYASPPADIANASTFHALTIIPVSPQPASCANASSSSGYFVYYLHLSSFLCDASSACPQDLKGQVAKKPKETSGHIVACPECAQPGTWVPVNSFLGYTGDFARTWGGVKAHLHFEVDLKKGSVLKPVDPYGWHPLNPAEVDPYSQINPGFVNLTLWPSFIP